MPRNKKKHWSYNAGERGRNWVRAFQDSRDGKLWLEWREPAYETDELTGERSNIMRADKTGALRPVHRRRSILLRGATKREAKRKADTLASKFNDMPERPTGPMSVTRLLTLYTREVTPTKGTSAQGHDRRAARVWIAFFGAQPEPGRRGARHPSTLDRVDWDRFTEWRGEGKIPGWKHSVRNRIIQQNLKFMIAVLRWATGVSTDGEPYLEVSPWNADVRAARGMVMPKEATPHRPGMPDDLRNKLIEYAPNWQFGLALVLERETRRRNSSLRQLRWSDIDQDAWAVRWSRDSDKAQRESVTPLTGPAIEALKQAPSRGIGSAPVFPSGKDARRPTPRDTFQTWLRRAKARFLGSLPESDREAVRERLRGVGFHSEKRSGVRDPEFRKLPPKIQETFSGTRFETLKDIYDHVSVDEMREALEPRNEAVSGSS